MPSSKTPTQLPTVSTRLAASEMSSTAAQSDTTPRATLQAHDQIRSGDPDGVQGERFPVAGAPQEVTTVVASAPAGLLRKKGHCSRAFGTPAILTRTRW